MSTHVTSQTDTTHGPHLGDNNGPSADKRQRAEPFWVTVMTREVMVKLTDRTFLVSTAVTLALMVGIFGFQAFMSQRDDSVDVAVTGPGVQQVTTHAQSAATSGEDTFTLDVHRYASAGAVRTAVRDGDVDAGLIHDSSGWQLLGNTDKEDRLASVVRQAVQHRTLVANAKQAGTTASALTHGSDVPYRLLDPDSHTGFSFVVGFAMAMLFYMAGLGYGMTIATSVVAEKQSRVVEILVSAIPVRHLLFGKILGNTIMALAQIALLTVVGLVGLTFTSYESLLPMVAGAVGWFVAFFIAGFFALACIWAVAGSLGTRHEDLQSTTAPLTMLLVVVLFAALALEGTGQVIASYIPVMSTVVMPMRLVSGTAAWWEPVIALLLTMAFVAVAVVVCERLFKRSVLQTQGRMSYRQALAAQE